jgi:hypothetical protein
MTAVSDGTASGGSAITTSGVAAADCTIATTGGTATYTVTITQAGAYRLWGSTIAPATNSDSFCVQIDGGAYQTWSLTTSTTWRWQALNSTFTLSAGAHTVRIRYREPGAKLDRLIVTNDLSLTP